MEPLQDHGFLLVKPFEVLYAQFAANPKFSRRIYAVPQHGTLSGSIAKRYHGLDRSPLDSAGPPPPSHMHLVAPEPFDHYKSACSVLAAQMRMHELEEEERSYQGILYDREGLDEILRWLEWEGDHSYETIWARVVGSDATPPIGFRYLGCESSAFPAGNFSPVCDALCFPRWHGTDLEGVLFQEYFVQLNSHALFDEPAIAAAFLKHYLSFSWTEPGDYAIAEVWVP